MVFLELSIPAQRKVIGNSEGRRGEVSKAKVFKGRLEAKLEIPEEWGVLTKKPSVGGLWICFGTTQCVLDVLLHIANNTNPNELKECVHTEQ